MTTISSEQLNTIEQAEPLTPEHDEIGATTNTITVRAEDLPAPQFGDVQSAPHFLDGVDDDVLADLAAVGITLETNPAQDLDDARRQAFAARLLKRAVEIEEASAEINDAAETEVQMIRANRDRRIAPLQREYAQIILAVEGLAGMTAWKKRKSADTAYGSYGVRHRGPGVELVDPLAAQAWAVEHRPECVKVTASLPLPDARERFSEAELATHGMRLEWGALKKTLDPDGELPPGISVVPACDAPFATPAKEG